MTELTPLGGYRPVNLSVVAGSLALAVIWLAPQTTVPASASPNRVGSIFDVRKEASSWLSSSVDESLIALLQSEAFATANISDMTVANTWTFLRHMPALTPTPYLYASDDREIGLSWIRADERFAVVVDNDLVAWSQKTGGDYLSGTDIQLERVEALHPVFTALTQFHGIKSGMSV